MKMQVAKCSGGLEFVFLQAGRISGTHPIKTLVVSVLVTIIMGIGFAFLESESRPEKQWVAVGSPALDDNEYVKGTWPSNTRFNLFVASCKKDSCNILDAAHVKRMHELHDKIMNITVDGDKIVSDLDKTHKTNSDSSEKDRPWGKFAGKWSFEGKRVQVERGDTVSMGYDGRMCYSFGPFCGKRSVLDLFRDDSQVIQNLDDEQVLRAVNFWENQENMCPLSIADAQSPCFADVCQKYDTRQERQQCRDLVPAYCNTKCPTRAVTTNGSTYSVPVDPSTCMDQGCVTMGVFSNMAQAQPNTTANATNSGPEAAFAFEPFKLSTAIGELQKSNGKYASGKHYLGYYVLNKNEYFLPADGTQDPLSDEWEKQALCIMGITADSKDKDLECKEDDLLKFTGLFGRSFGDEFGNAIRGDVGLLSASYFVIIVYCIVLIGKRDPVHSGITMGFVAVLIVGMTIAATMGLMGFCGVPNSSLNNNLYFLVLGLGVDDAFVLSSEFLRHSSMSPDLPISEKIARTAQTGGISVLITSATDALAFLVGASTVLPALSWFCTYAGVAIVFCFLFQLFVFLPCLTLNAKRAEADRRDCFCCFKVQEHREITDPKGCCLCCKCQDGIVRRCLNFMIDKATTLPGQITVLVLFLALAIVGIIGCTQLYKDFKLEWFIPDDSYVNEFFQLNREHFSSGTPVSVNIKSTPGHFESQANLRELYAYLSTAKYTKDGDSGSWYKEFMDWSVADAQATRWTLTPSPSSPKAEFAKRDEFHTALHQWYRSSVGGRYRNLVQWADTDCNVESTMEQLPAGCDLSKGIKASRFSAEVGAEYTTTGNVRYDTMDTMRKEIHDIYPNAFPWNFDFLYWEEVGVIDVEFVRNIIICGVVVCIMVFMLVPAPRIAIWVVVCISLSIVDVLGMMYFWDVTISGVSTIYVLISIGLAVDYSAHIAHMFKESMGSPRERALAAIDRIGPSTFNAVFSTFLAVVVVGFSKSFVFRVFFKVLFLVTSISGAHGIVLLPVILSIVGGSQADETVKTVDDANQAESDDPKMQAEIDPKEANTAP